MTPGAEEEEGNVYWVFKAVLKPSLRAIYRIRVEGLEHVPKKGPAIIAANHLSFMDSFFIPLVIKWRKVTYLAKADYFKSWKTAWFFRSVGQISTEREGGRKSQQALGIALEVLRDGNLLGIYPEGTRSPDGRLHRGRTGVARLALASGVPVVPCGVTGSDEVMPKGRRFPRLSGRLEVRVRFGPALDLSQYAGKERDRVALRSVTREISSAIMKLSGQEYVDQYASRTAVAQTVPEDDIDLSDEILAG
jgi:1-acyl-sn-glycerol-3-phosphate acyltransferase